MSIKQEYKKKEEEFLGRANDVEEITKERDEQKLHYEQLRKQRLDEFMAGFNSISLKLKEMYQVSSALASPYVGTYAVLDDHAWRER